MSSRQSSSRFAGGTLSAVVLLTSLLLACLSPSLAAAEEANLTQFGPKEYQRGAGSPGFTSDTFTAADAPARLIVRGERGAKVRIRLNDRDVVGLSDLDGRTISTRVDLAPSNRIAVRVQGKPGSTVTVRVKQRVTVDTRTTGVSIYGLQVTDFEREMEFWRKFGLLGVINPAGPETNTLEMAQVLGLDAPYRLKVALHWVNTIGVGGAADTVQFIDPFRSDPPYAKLNHLGFTHVTYGTGNLDAAVSYLRSEGINVTSDPVGIPGSRYVFVRDDDGTYFRLVEDSSAPAQATPTALTEMKSIALNASDLDATMEYLKLFGFTQAEPVRDAARRSTPEARAWGFPGGYRNIGFDLSNPGNPAAPKIELRRWQEPYDSEPSYPLPMNHLGIDRLIFSGNTPNLIASAESLKAAGVQEVGPPARCCNGNSSPGGIGLWTGPDGIIVEFTGPIPR